MALLAFLNLLGDFVESFADVAHFDFSDDGFDDGFDCLGGDDGLVVVVVVVVVIVIDDFATLGGRECRFVFFHGVVEELAGVDFQDAAAASARFLFLGCGGFGGHLHCLDHLAMSLRQFHVFPNLAMKLRWKHIFVAQMAPGFQKHTVRQL